MTIRRLLGLTAGAALAVMVSACGSSSDGVGVTDPGAGSSTTAASSTTGATGTNLTIRVVDGGKTSSWTLTCDPDGSGSGTQPTPDDACAALAKHGRTALPPVSSDMACSEIYGGPQTATITGTYLGQRVSSSFKRTNGCEVSRWEALSGLLPTVSGAGSAPATMSHGPGPQ